MPGVCLGEADDRRTATLTIRVRTWKRQVERMQDENPQQCGTQNPIPLKGL